MTISAVERIVLGSGSLGMTPNAGKLLSRFVAGGGKALDLANVYGDGAASRAVGRWLAGSSARTSVTLYVKGCHPPYCTPAHVRREVNLARVQLGVDVLDRFILHRDNTTVPVETWAEALNAEIGRGAVAAVGVSNWTLGRFRALRRVFGEEAAKIALFSNHFSLAEMVTPAAPGCAAMTSADLRELATEDVEALAWASIALGFFAGANPTAWRSDVNRDRRRRAQEIAAENGVAPTAIALAYVLRQTGGVLAAVGTRSIGHLDELLQAATVELSPLETAWLENGVS